LEALYFSVDKNEGNEDSANTVQQIQCRPLS